MNALVKTGPGPGNMEISAVPDPVPAEGQVLIKVERTGICGSDIHVLKSDILIKMSPPVVTGHEFAGTISALGPKTGPWQIGDEVVSETSIGFCGTCPACRSGYYNLCPDRKVLGYWHNGAFAPYVVVPASRLHRVPTNVGLREAALTEPLACVVHAVLEETRISAGDLVVITGPGAIGLLSLQVARAHGARVVVLGTRRDPERLRLARELGADLAIDTSGREPDALRSEIGTQHGADVVLECSGSAAAVDAGLELLRRRGRFTQIGLFGRSAPVALDVVTLKEIALVGAISSRYSSWERALALLACGAVKVDALITHELPLSEWKRGFELFESQEGIKILLDPER